MVIALRLANLKTMHPRLLWDEIIAAAAAVLEDRQKSPFLFTLEVRNIAGIDDAILDLAIHSESVPPIQVAQIRRTYEPARLVELAAIAIAGLGLGTWWAKRPAIWKLRGVRGEATLGALGNKDGSA